MALGRAVCLQNPPICCDCTSGPGNTGIGVCRRFWESLLWLAAVLIKSRIVAVRGFGKDLWSFSPANSLDLQQRVRGPGHPASNACRIERWRSTAIPPTGTRHRSFGQAVLRQDFETSWISTWGRLAKHLRDEQDRVG